VREMKIKLLRKIFKKKKIQIKDLSTGKNVSKHVEISFTGIVNPKDDNKLGPYTEYSGLGA